MSFDKALGRALGVLSGRAALGNLVGVLEVWREIPISQQHLALEALFMLHIPAGVPRALDALSVVASPNLVELRKQPQNRAAPHKSGLANLKHQNETTEGSSKRSQTNISQYTSAHNNNQDNSFSNDLNTSVNFNDSDGNSNFHSVPATTFNAQLRAYNEGSTLVHPIAISNILNAKCGPYPVVHQPSPLPNNAGENKSPSPNSQRHHRPTIQLPSPVIYDWKSPFELVYGDVADKLLHNLLSLHPHIPEFMLNTAYGVAFNRNILPISLVEICVASVTASLKTYTQFYSHSRGYILNGGPPDVLLDVLAALLESNDISETQHQEVLEIYDKVRKSTDGSHAAYEITTKTHSKF